MSPPRKKNRIDAIDSMRGLASLMVACHHFNDALGPDFAWLSALPRNILYDGALGVHIFFVLSGYVIALSTEKLRPCWSNVGRFVVRRGVRLDPPYLASIVLAVGLLAISGVGHPGFLHTLPSLGSLLSHVVYLQNILGYGNILVVYWSLCFEVQMYLLYLLLFFAESRLTVGRTARRTTLTRIAVWYPLLLVSLLLKYEVLSFETPGWCLPFWFLFFLGAQVRWLHSGRIGRGELLPGLVLFTALGAHGATAEYLAIMVGLATVFWHRQLAEVGGFRPLLFLGGLSYSLYLVHPIVGGRFVVLVRRLAGGEISPVGSVVVFLAGILVSVLAAWLLYLAVERPTMRLSRRVVLQRRTGA